MSTFLGIQWEFYKHWFISLHITLSPQTVSMFLLPLKLCYSKCGLRTSSIGNVKSQALLLDQLNQNLHLNDTLRCFIYMLKFEKHHSKTNFRFFLFLSFFQKGKDNGHH